MVQDTPSRKLDQYIVRFPDGMRDRLKAAAAANNRSMNAEIISRLEASLAPRTGFPLASVVPMTPELSEAVRIVVEALAQIQENTEAVAAKPLPKS